MCEMSHDYDASSQPSSSSGRRSAVLDENHRRQIVMESKLRRTCNYPQQLPIVYHSTYDIQFAGLEKCHPFDAGKWGRIVGYLEDDGMIKDSSVLVKPKEATKDDLLVVHTESYLSGLNWSAKVAAIMEVPFVACVPNFLVQRYALKPFRYQVGGTVAAAYLAMELGWAINAGGGFHHCSARSGGGFCAYADITIAIRFLVLSGLIKKAMIVDLDAHQGNGHERDFGADPNVFILDMYNADIYPHDTQAKQGISRRVELFSGCRTETYMNLLQHHLPECLNAFKPDFVLYNAGTDCLDGDPLGCMRISDRGIVSRDECVFFECRQRKIPICMVTSGGYQRNNARIIANSIMNLKTQGLIGLQHAKPE